MEEKKIKNINIRISLEDYQYLKETYYWYQELSRVKFKSFSAYIRYLLDLGLNDYH